MKSIVMVFIITLFTAYSGFTQLKVGIYGALVTPYGRDARDYNRPGYGVGANVVYSLPQTNDFLAGVLGIDYVNLLSEDLDGVDYVGGVPVPFTQETGQGLFRLYLGPQVGAHGEGILRPYAGFNLALVVYGITTDIVIKDSNYPYNEIRKNKSRDIKSVFGFDATMGVDLRFWKEISIEGGIKYLKSFSLPQQLGEGAITIYPQYIQYFLGIGINFDLTQHPV